MKKTNFILVAVFVFAAFLSNAQDTKKDFFGMWTLEIEDGSVGWLGVNDSEGFLDAELLWKGGSVTPVSHVYFIDDNTLAVTRTNKRQVGEEREHVITQMYKFKRKGDKIEGMVISPARNGMSLDVDLAEGKPTTVVGNELLEHRGEALARFAPLGPEIEQYRLGC